SPRRDTRFSRDWSSDVCSSDLPVLTYLNPLVKETLLNILAEPKNALTKQYVKLFQYEGVELLFDKEVYDFIVDKAWEFKLGAREIGRASGREGGERQWDGGTRR